MKKPVEPAPKDGTPEARSLTSAVFAILKREIISCRLRPGEKLHIGKLAAAYDVSLAAVREALSRLAASGLVVAEDQRGFRVSPASIKDLDVVTDTRIEIECLALKRSIARGGADWLENIQAAWVNMSGAKPGMDRWPVVHNEFHASLVGACGLEWLMRFRAVLFEQSERYRSLSRQPKSPSRELEAEHRALMEATLVLASLIRKFTFEIRASQVPLPVGIVTTQPDRPLYVTIGPRRPTVS